MECSVSKLVRLLHVHDFFYLSLIHISEGALEAILTECEEMFRVYEELESGDENKKKDVYKRQECRCADSNV